MIYKRKIFEMRTNSKINTKNNKTRADTITKCNFI